MLGYVTDPAAPAGIIRRELPEPQPGEHDVCATTSSMSDGSAIGWAVWLATTGSSD
jgi:hypothetical protein